MSSDSIGVQPDELDSTEPLTRIKIETEQPLDVDSNTFEQAVKSATTQFETIQYSEVNNDTNIAYLIVESNPLSIDLSVLTTEIENVLDCHVKATWVRRAFYDELNDVRQDGMDAVETDSFTE